ncbi:DUF2842 domain-containing protein [Rhodomicrobium sp. Az07]|uniref:DUF2842 domain-containing protein n=1 Tax=Rhodomicrobium sp. Az07 TaxID=2839034 RepID=UPI001BE985EE|nr:DUF2842 domain-containing protein [Rhodomicrobium sp. Az07]MBT3070775.1 DUF2842 domain-containing protein [Rhodomicrobium sp. Az07]
MTPRLRKLIGVTVFVAGSLLYFLFTISIALARLPGTELWRHLLFYLVITLIWLVWAGILVKWMLKPRPGEAGQKKRAA